MASVQDMQIVFVIPLVTPPSACRNMQEADGPLENTDTGNSLGVHHCDSSEMVKATTTALERNTIPKEKIPLLY
jgi:hypothetical protein